MKFGLLAAALIALIVLFWWWPRPAPPGSVQLVPYGTGHRVVLNQAGERMTLATLGVDEGLRNITWSPGNRCFAFETYTSQSNSPMMTGGRTWVGSPDSGTASAIRLPAEQERFSVFIEQWDDPYTLVVHATVLEPPQDLSYRYDCRNGQLEGPVWR